MPQQSPWVVIPTYNEKENVENMITALFGQDIPNLTILIVDDSSPDKTADIVRKLQEQHPSLKLLIRKKKNGLGQAYIHGFQYALDHGAMAIVQMDCDFSHDPNDVPKLLSKLEDHDLVLGSRYCNGISVINWPLKRLLISMGGTLYARTITGMPYRDLTGGFKAWKAEILNKINLDTIKVNGYGFQILTTFRARKNEARIIEVPIVFTERRQGNSKMSKSIIWEAVWLVWRLRLLGS